MRILAIDIETRANLIETYQCYGKLHIAPYQIIRPVEMVSFAAKWLQSDWPNAPAQDSETVFFSKYHNKQQDMLNEAWTLLDQADVLLHFNGNTFDTPHIQREFVQAHMTPPSPFQQIDLLRTMRKQFNFPMNRLAYVTEALGLKGKVEHEGMYLLLRRCEDGDKDALKRLREYNVRDVTELEDLYYRVQPWIAGHPNRAALAEKEVCPRCGGHFLQKRGLTAPTAAGMRYQRYQCTSCGGWSQTRTRVNAKNHPTIKAA